MNYMGKIKALSEKIGATNLLRPCSKEEIKEIALSCNYPLPASYLEFLRNMGRGAGEFLKGSSCFYPEILELRNWAEELLVENSFTPLPDDAFVVWMHQGYQFLFFRAKEGEDPPLYFYLEGQSNDNFIKKEDSFTDFLSKSIPKSGGT